MTLGEALASGIRTLSQHHVPSPDLDAELLLAHCLGRDRTYIHAHRNDAAEDRTRKDYDALLARRASREPLQYITGFQEFYGRRFAVNPSVLIPRPETEFLVDVALGITTWKHPRIVDVGTGSGCIAVTLALELPSSRVYASDLTLDSVKTARENSRALGALVRFACVDGLSAWKQEFEIIVSNPPYVVRDQEDGLQPEVREYEPHLALFGNRDPIQFYRQLFDQAGDRLVPGGVIAVEIGYSMEDAVRGLPGARWEVQPSIRDLQGIPRVVAARKR